MQRDNPVAVAQSPLQMFARGHAPEIHSVGRLFGDPLNVDGNLDEREWREVAIEREVSEPRNWSEHREWLRENGGRHLDAPRRRGGGALDDEAIGRNPEVQWAARGSVH